MSEKQVTQPPKKPNYLALGISLGMTFGVAIGVVFGIALGNMAFMSIGIGSGLSIGLAIGVALDERNEENDAQDWHHTHGLGHLTKKNIGLLSNAKILQMRERFKLGTTCARNWAIAVAKRLFWLILRRYKS